MSLPTTFFIGRGGGGESALYDFTSFTFTNAGQTGRTGPSLSQCQTAYSSQAFLSGFFTMTTQGYQQWTAPSTGDYTFTVKGAEGGTSSTQGPPTGKGAVLNNFIVPLNSGDVLTLIVGQYGGNVQYSGGGGGGSFVVKGSDLLLAAGGGGGGGFYNPNQAGQNASTTVSVVGSTAPQGGDEGNNLGGGGGAGFSGDGSNGSYAGAGGHDFNNGFEGGVGDGGTARADGGFGGGAAGGGGSAANAGGGAGGFRGGDGQQGSSPWSNGDASTNARAANVTAGSVSANNTNHGSITITAPT